MAEIVVTSTADSGAGSLRQAIADAQDGDVIRFDTTVYPTGTTTAILLSSTLNIPKNIEIDGDGRVALDGQNAIRVCTPSASSGNAAHLKGLTIKNGSYFNGAGVLLQYGAPILTDCIIEDCVATSSAGGVYAMGTVNATLNNCTIRNNVADSGGGALYSAGTSQVALNACIITGCTATTYGGGVYTTGSSQNTLNNCTINGCSATDGGGVFSTISSQNTLNNCIISDCSATYGGGVFSTNSSQNTLNDCTINGCSATASGGGIYTSTTSQTTLNGCHFDAVSDVMLSSSTSLFITEGITTIAVARLNAATITIDDGAALTITDSATIGAATFTSDGRGYLAVAAGIDTSAATLTNVVLCAYGAGLTAFDATITGDAASATWTQTDAMKTILLEADSGSGYATLTQSAAGSYTFTTPSPTTYKFLAFDGAQFFRKTVTRTYYYIGGAEGSFTSASDWSLTSGGAAISAAPTVKDCKFIIE